MKTLFISLLILGSALGSKPTNPATGAGGVSVLKVDPATSTINWKAEKATGSHAGTVAIKSGTLTMYCGQLAKGTVLIDMSAVSVTDLAAPDKQKLENNLRGDNFFDTEKFPEARLEIVSVDHRSEKLHHFVTVLGNITLHGITKQIVFTADVAKSNYNDFAGQADITLNRKDFGVATNNIKYNTFIYKDIRLHVAIQANKTDEQVTSL
ncbi:YceI family protein [Mucilaginibacter ginsenosidivorans]|uniref:YceI family protein n=1 Tax=Mucilaginibacter ginsenosidivorans TaxID=398053 RepID=A0A5B8UWH3_9SPHI|nr:YceI family protein [Mucilaginibacter ginsenosidivorans]QEC63487.1 YceI family protein [Mucilaginibacter ginsenosidivorans]